MNNALSFKSYACCIPVRGYFRSCICDLQRGKVLFIPNVLCEILLTFDGKNIQSVISHYGDDNKAQIEEYFLFLEKEQMIFFTETPQLFPSISLVWKYPALVTNAVVDIGEHKFNWKSLSEQLENVFCTFLQVRIFERIDMAELKNIFSLFDERVTTSIELIAKFNESVSDDEWKNLCNEFPRIFLIYLHSSPSNRTIQINQHGSGNILEVDTPVSSQSHCGIINTSYFSINIETFTESHHHNTCLNRKIAIDVDGNIKNCPSMAESFGNIRDTTLEEALAKPGFKKYWDITKDKIHVCKDCEFRHICTDCRAYVEDPEDIFSKPLKCGYNPYTGEWSEWSTNPLQQKAIDHYGLREIVDIAGEGV